MMTLDEAKKITGIYETLKHYEKEYDDFKNYYHCISGDLFDDANATPFRWEKDSIYYQAILEMLKKVIQELKYEINRIEVNENESKHK